METSVRTAKGKSKRQELFSAESIDILRFSIESLWRAAKHPYCLDKLKKCAKPVAISAASIYFVGLILMLPLLLLAHLLRMVSLGRIPTDLVTDSGRKALTSAVSLVPFLALVILRSFIRKPIFKCFIHLLRELNPPVAQGIEANSSLTGGGSSESRKRKSKRRGFIQRIALLLAFEVVLRFARKSPWLGRPAVAVSHFYTMKKALGRDRAVALSLFALVPLLEPWLLTFVQLWRTSSLLGQELVVDYVSKYVPPGERSTWFKNHDVDISLFALPGSLLLQVPFVGPLAFFPIQASAAYLVDRLARQSSLDHSAGAPLQERGGKAHAPTLPDNPPMLASGAYQ